MMKTREAVSTNWVGFDEFSLTEPRVEAGKVKMSKPASSPTLEEQKDHDVDDTGTVGSATYMTAIGTISKPFSPTPMAEKEYFVDNWLGEEIPATTNTLSLYNHQESSQNSFLQLPNLYPKQEEESIPETRPSFSHRSSSSFGNPWTGMSYIGIEYNNRWPTPESVEQVEAMSEHERKKGSSQSQLALCLHFMECAFRMQSSNNNTSSSTLSRSHFRKTLEGAMIFSAKTTIKQLATTSQGVGKGGEAEAQYLLGNCYGMGAFHWAINHQAAFQWYTQASKQDHPEATYRTAVCYELGIGTSKDGARAILFYRKAALLNNVASMYKLGIISMRGYCDQPISKREAVTWLQRAATTAVQPTITSNPGRARSLPHALHALAIIQLTGECKETSLISDTDYAIGLLEEAARLGYAPSQSKLGECYECGIFCEMDETQSLYWYTQAAKQDYPEATLALSGWYLTGSLKTNALPQSDHEAYLWARRAATLVQTHSSASSLKGKVYFTIGIYYQNGIGVKKSNPNAFKWFKRAACAGHPGAFKILSSM
jgi:TPR repeat protein